MSKVPLCAGDHGPQAGHIVAERIPEGRLAGLWVEARHGHGDSGHKARRVASRNSQTHPDRTAERNAVCGHRFHKVRNGFNRLRMSVIGIGPKYRLSKLHGL